MYQVNEKKVLCINEIDTTKEKVVSIICLTFNHEKYIEKTIQSFIDQQTNFDFEIIIHDDASTDQTPAILKFFQAKYPGKIHLIIQKENQYSKFGFASVLKTALDAATGQYLAFCEGDDYWCDNSKLQLQVDVLNETNAGLCFHPAAELRDAGITNPNLELYESKLYSCSELIRKDFHFVQTSSIVFSRDALDNLSYDIISRSPVADVIIRLAATIDKGAVCVPVIASIYRVMSEGSWTSSMQNEDKFLNYIKSMLDTIDELNFFYADRIKSDLEYYKSMFVLSLALNDNIPLTKKLGYIGRLKFKYKIKCISFVLYRKLFR